MDNIKWIQSLLREAGVDPRRQRGQNFLLDETVAERIVTSAEVGKEDTVIEIGPGLGAMSEILAERAGKLILIEIETAFAARLKDHFAFRPEVTVIEADAASFDYAGFCAEQGIDGYKVVANLPYSVTTPVIKQLLQNGGPWQSMTLMLQKEAAKRIAKGKGRENGPLTLLMEYYADAELLFDVPPKAFYPAPAVNSAILQAIRREPAVDAEPAALYRFLERCFLQRRKLLTNSLNGSYGRNRQQWAELLTACGFSETVRAEELTLADFACLFDSIKK